MKDNYYSLKNKNHINSGNKKNYTKRKRTSKNVKYGSHYEKEQSNFRKRKNKKLNSKKVFFALLILILIIYFIFFGFSKLFLHNEKEVEVPVVAEPQDIKITMAVTRRYNVPFNQF